MFTKEDAPTNAASNTSAGKGRIAGIGVGTNGEPGVTKTKYRSDNIKNAPDPIIAPLGRRKTFTQFIQGK